MDVIKGKIQKKSSEEGISKTGMPYVRTIFTIDDKDYSTFDDKIAKEFMIGDNVKMTGEKSGIYWNMKTMEKCDGAAPNVPSVVVEDLLRLILSEIKNIRELLTKQT